MGHTALSCLPLWTCCHSVHWPLGCESSARDPKSYSSKHARWWSKVFTTGVRKLDIVHVYRAGWENGNADALPRVSCGNPSYEPMIMDVQLQLAALQTKMSSQTLTFRNYWTLHLLQRLESHLQRNRVRIRIDIALYTASEQLPDCPQKVRKFTAKAQLFTLLNVIVYFLDSKRGGRKRCLVPKHLQQSIIEENHSHWWWPNMYNDVINHCSSCPQCAIVNSSGKVNRPPLHLIPVQCVGVDVIDLPKTEAGNKHVVVF